VALQATSTAAHEAVRAGADENHMIDYCVQNLSTMADRARLRSALAPR
jgi:hypothetical protein